MYIGLMTGTSADAVDAVLVAFHAGTTKLLAQNETPIPPSVQAQIKALFLPDTNEIDRLGELDNHLANLYAEAVARLLKVSGRARDEIIAIGCHGQTIRHRPELKSPFTLQIGNPHLLAAKAGICVVSDFRRKDMALGGQGAPLTPVFHRYMNHNTDHSAVLNLGGIANITALGEQTIGYDTGPANALLDAWIAKNRGIDYDKNGAWARGGMADAGLVRALMKEPYFHKKYPKSTGKELFNIEWLERQLKVQGFSRLAPNDIQASLTELTVESVASAIERWHSKLNTLYLCGGGALNNYLVERLKARLKDIEINTSDAFGVPPNLVEACAFAYLAKLYIEKKPGNIPSVTGASHAAILGSLSLPD